MNRRTFFRWALRAGAALVGLGLTERIRVANKTLAQVDDNLYGPAGVPYPSPAGDNPPPIQPSEPYPWPMAEIDDAPYPFEPAPTVTADQGAKPTGQPKLSDAAEEHATTTRAPRK